MVSLLKVSAAILCSAIWSVAAAQEGVWLKKASFSIAEPVEVPGAVLQPGTYVIRVVQGFPSRSLIEVVNADETEVLARMVGIPDYRARVDLRPFTFHLTRGRGPRPVQTWYYPGDPAGLELVYPRNRARAIARQTDQRVMAAETPREAVLAVTPSGVEVRIAPAMTAAENAAADSPATVDPALEPPLETDGQWWTPAEYQEPAEPEQLPPVLPSTATNVAWLAVAGWTSLGGLLCALWKRLF